MEADIISEMSLATGDCDGDGLADLAVGDSFGDTTAAGVTYLLSGPIRGIRNLAYDADATVEGESAYDESGASVALRGDANDDGYDDLLVGAQSEGTSGLAAGAVYLVYGPVSGSADLGAADIRLVGEDRYDQCGTSVSWAGDLDGDGRADLLVGCPLESSGGTTSGAAYVVHATSLASGTLALADAKLRGEASDDDVGRTVASAGDTNADGLDDLLVAAPGNDEGQIGGGAVYLLLGSGL